MIKYTILLIYQLGWNYIVLMINTNNLSIHCNNIIFYKPIKHTYYYKKYVVWNIIGSAFVTHFLFTNNILLIYLKICISMINP